MTSKEPALDTKTWLTIIAMIVALVAVFYSARLATADDISVLKSDIRNLDTRANTYEATMIKITDEQARQSIKLDTLLIDRGYKDKVKEINSITTAP